MAHECFYAMINIATINSFVMYCHNILSSGQKIIPQRYFLKRLYYQLVEPWLKIRLAITTMSTHVKENILTVQEMVQYRTPIHQNTDPSRAGTPSEADSAIAEVVSIPTAQNIPTATESRKRRTHVPRPLQLRKKNK